MSILSYEILRIGAWIVDPRNGELRHSETAEVHRLTPKQMSVLVVLAHGSGDCVSRQELIERVWQRTYVQDEVLTRMIADLRKLLKDDGASNAYIVTVPKRGYRLVRPATKGEPPEVDEPIIAEEKAKTEASAAELDEGSDSIPPKGFKSRRIAIAMLAIAAIVGAAVGYKVSRSSAVEVSRAEAFRVRLSNALPAVAGESDAYMPRWVDDGRSFVYVEQRQPGATRIVLFDTGSRASRIVVDSGGMDVCPAASRDGSQIAWTRYLDGECKVMTAMLSGQMQRSVAACRSQPPAPLCVEFSEDGSSIIYTPELEMGVRSASLNAVDLATGRISNLRSMDGGDGVILAHPRISPHGSGIAFVAVKEWPFGDIYASSEADQFVLMVSGRNENRGFSWTERPGELLVSTDAFHAPGLHLLEGGVLKRLGERSARNPDVSRSGATVFEQRKFQANIWLAESGSREFVRLTHSLMHDAAPRFSADGASVLYNSNRSGLESLWTYDLSSKSEYPLPLDSSMRWLRPSWSVGGGAIYTTAYHRNEYRACIFDVPKSSVECPDAWRGQEQRLEVKPDLFVIETSGKSGRTVYRELNGHQELIVDAVKWWRASGEHVAVQHQDGRISVFNLVGPTVSLERTFDASSGAPFALRGNSFYLLEEASGGYRLKSIDLRTGQVERLDFPDLPGDVVDFDVSPDGMSLVVEGFVERRSSILVAPPPP